MGLWSYIRGVFRKMINFNTVQQAAKIDTPLSTDMQNALQEWAGMYQGRAPWLMGKAPVKSLNLPAHISSELARQIVLEMKCSITGAAETQPTPRSEFLAAEFEKVLTVLRQKLEQGCAAGGMIIKPYVSRGHLYFDFVMDWDIYPVAFDDDGNLSDVILPDYFSDGNHYYTRLERHTLAYAADGSTQITITQKAYKSTIRETLGNEISLQEVDRWKDLDPITVLNGTDGQMFGWYKTSAANAVDINSCMGASVFAKARDVIEQADIQYSRLLWEYEGSELAVDVDPTALRKDPKGRYELPALNDRLFRAVDVDQGDRDLYEVFSPAIRDQSLLAGLNALLQKIEDLSGLSRGALSDANEQAKTATELKIVKQRSYATVADNQKALERALRDVLRVMDKYCSLFGLAPEGEYEASFDWDDSILVDSDAQLAQMITLKNAGIVSKEEFRIWYFGETEEQAKAALDKVNQESTADFDRAFAERDE